MRGVVLRFRVCSPPAVLEKGQSALPCLFCIRIKMGFLGLGGGTLELPKMAAEEAIRSIDMRLQAKKEGR